MPGKNTPESPVGHQNTTEKIVVRFFLFIFRYSPER